MSSGELVYGDAEARWPPDEATIASRPRVIVALGALAAAGVAADATLRAGHAGVGVTVVVALAVAAVIVATGSPRPGVLALGVLAVACVTGPAVRTAPALVAIDTAIALVLVGLGAGYARAGTPTALSGGEMARRLARAAGALALAPDRVARYARHLVATPGGAWNRGLALRLIFGVAPVLIALFLVMRSADPVLASWFEVPGVGDVAGHVVVSLVCAVVAGAPVVVGLQQPVPSIPEGPSRVGGVEALVMLGGLTIVYMLFGAAQGAALLGGADYVVTTTGLTYAEYARSGFFQLLVAAGITAAVLLTVRARIASEPMPRRGWLRTLGLLSVGLTLGAVAVAMRRLALYIDAFGLTTDRFAAMAVAAWIAIVLAIVAVAVAGVGRPHRWLVPVLAAASLVVLAVVNVLNPAGFVMSHNLERAARGEGFDRVYANALSPDAVPALAAGLDRLSPAEAAFAREILCAGHDGNEAPAGWNLGRRRAEAARERVCGAQPAG